MLPLCGAHACAFTCGHMCTPPPDNLRPCVRSWLCVVLRVGTHFHAGQSILMKLNALIKDKSAAHIAAAMAVFPQLKSAPMLELDKSLLCDSLWPRIESAAGACATPVLGSAQAVVPPRPADTSQHAGSIRSLCGGGQDGRAVGPEREALHLQLHAAHGFLGEGGGGARGVVGGEGGGARGGAGGGG